jgi:CubicO group peptidase (beta-lactamase class C family)
MDYNFDNRTAINDSVALNSFIETKMKQYHFPGLAACIVKNDQVIWQGNFGYADREKNKLVTDSTSFHIASASKPITGTALLKLWEKGYFELDDDINDYLPFEVRNPSFPDDSLTFRMLLTHTSSIDHHPGLININISTPGADCAVSLDSFLVNYLLPEGSYYWMGPFLNHSPGTYFKYTTPGFALIGYLVENITDTCYEDYCQKIIFTPLGMNNTSWFLENININNFAKQYTYFQGKYSTTPYMGRPDYPGVMLKSSASQVARLLMAFIQKGEVSGVRILESATVDSMTTIQNPILNPIGGLVWNIDRYAIPDVGARSVCYHFGSVTGANSFIGYILGTGENVGIVVWTNSRDDWGMIEISLKLLSYGILTDIEKELTQLPKIYFLGQNYPNPFNPSTTIEYALPKPEHVNITIYTMLGQTIETIIDKRMPLGHHQVEFNGQSLPSGVYFYRLEAGEYVQTRKMLLVK